MNPYTYEEYDKQTNYTATSGTAIAPASDYAVKLAQKLNDSIVWVDETGDVIDPEMLLAAVKASRGTVYSVSTPYEYEYDIPDLAEAYLEAFRELGQVVGIQSDSETYFFAVANPGWNGRVSNEAIDVHNLLLDLAEDEGWDVEEMEGL